MDFQPVVYEHAAALIRRTPWQVSRDADLLFAAHAAAFRTYRHRPVTVGIDIYNVEAEAYGARISRPSGAGVPAVEGPLCASPGELLALPPLSPDRFGRFPLLLAAGARLAQTFPEADIRLPLCGPFSLASALVGFDALLGALLDDPDLVRTLLLHLVGGQRAVYEAARARGLGIVVFESAAAPPMVSPAAFESIVLPALVRLVSDVSRTMECPVPCIVGGNTEPILEALLRTGTTFVICPFETDQEAFLRRLSARSDVRVRINMDARVLAAGPWSAIEREANRVLALAEGRENVCIGSGALPYEASPESVTRVKTYVEERG